MTTVPKATPTKGDVTVTIHHLGHMEVTVGEQLFASIVPSRSGFTRTIFTPDGHRTSRNSTTYAHAVEMLVHEAKAYGVEIPVDEVPEDAKQLIGKAFHDAAGAFARLATAVDLHLIVSPDCAQSSRLKSELEAAQQKYQAAQDLAYKGFRKL